MEDTGGEVWTSGSPALCPRLYCGPPPRLLCSRHSLHCPGQSPQSSSQTAGTFISDISGHFEAQVLLPIQEPRGEKPANNLCENLGCLHQVHFGVPASDGFHRQCSHLEVQISVDQHCHSSPGCPFLFKVGVPQSL